VDNAHANITKTETGEKETVNRLAETGRFYPEHAEFSESKT
jgi:hypothetical protein